MRHHCAKNPDRVPREFKKSQCRHCGKILHGNGLRAHVAQVHPEQYARSRSVRAHRMKEQEEQQQEQEQEQEQEEQEEQEERRRIEGGAKEERRKGEG